jgi:hypothetical protein
MQMETCEKRTYRAPRLVEYGRVEEITRGPWGGSFDSLFGMNGGLNPGDPPVHGTST